MVRGGKGPSGSSDYMIIDRYLFRNLLIAAVFTLATLAAVVILTQSLQFLELVMNAGASIGAFWFLTLLSLPRFFEIIAPITVMAATVFVYNRMTVDSELTVMRASGAAPLRLARPAIILAALATALLWATSLWLSPLAQVSMDNTRDMIRSQYSALMFQGGVFNSLRPGLTVFVRDRDSNGQLHGLMIHDSRDKGQPAITIAAKRGELLNTPQGQQVVVYDGVREDINNSSGALEALNFDRYTIDLPENAAAIADRWKEPNERTFGELLHPTQGDVLNAGGARDFRVEIHRRLVSPLLAPAFVLLALSFLLLGPVERRGQSWRAAGAVFSALLIQGLYMAAFNLSRRADAGLILMYLTVFIPLIGGASALGAFGDWRAAPTRAQEGGAR